MTSSKQKPERDLLFWSGGKDAYLALLCYMDAEETEPLLLTTYDDESNLVPHQNIPVEAIHRQAIALELTLFTVPLSYPASNEQYLETIRNSIEEMPYRVNRIIFGDLHLEDIRGWREVQFHRMGFETLFPIWNKPYDELFDRLEQEDVTITISGVEEKYRDVIEPGARFSREFAASLPSGIDKMGENGEFHTRVWVGSTK
jgi:diphthamide synthase (EF-2-diphthine--ammonia ligase)